MLQQPQFVFGWVFSCSRYMNYDDVIMGKISSQITSLTVVYAGVYSDADQRKHQSAASLAFVWGIHRGPVNSPHKWPVTRKMFPFDDVITWSITSQTSCQVMKPVCNDILHLLERHLPSKQSTAFCLKCMSPWHEIRFYQILFTNLFLNRQKLLTIPSRLLLMMRVS